MFVVLDEEAEQRLFQLAGARSPSDATPLLKLTATLDAEEELIVVRVPEGGPAYLAPRPGEALPCLAFPVHPDQAPSYPVGLVAPGTGQLVVLAVAGAGTPSLRAFFFPSQSAPPQACETEVVRLETDIFSRLKGVFDTRVLASKTVAVIGVGSGGGIGAVELAKAGVGSFILVDFDRLKAHNIARHVCGLADVGRFKTRAVRDRVLQHNPQASAECHEVDITQDGDLLDRIVAASDLVFVATDNELSRYLINEACLGAGTSAVYGGVYERAFAGEVVRVIPGAAGCYACVRQGLANTMRSISNQQVFDYTEDEELQAEPGLGLDVTFIALIHAKLALMTLLRGTQSALGDIDAEMIIWTNSARPQDGELFERPLTRHLVHVPRSKDCPSCGGDTDNGADEEGGPS
jgi:molybdopterin/thiamine biosynthesis adenylyltransferase